MPYPAEALAAFPPAAVETVTTSTNTDGDVTSELSSFLAAASAPLAIILKPPHELLTLEPSQLARTTAASYGSFNFHKLRVRAPCTEHTRSTLTVPLLHSACATSAVHAHCSLPCDRRT